MIFVCAMKLQLPKKPSGPLLTKSRIKLEWHIMPFATNHALSQRGNVTLLFDWPGENVAVLANCCLQLPFKPWRRHLTTERVNAGFGRVPQSVSHNLSPPSHGKSIFSHLSTICMYTVLACPSSYNCFEWANFKSKVLLINMLQLLLSCTVYSL